jgi:hypothetical protein
MFHIRIKCICLNHANQSIFIIRIMSNLVVFIDILYNIYLGINNSEMESTSFQKEIYIL